MTVQTKKSKLKPLGGVLQKGMPASPNLVTTKSMMGTWPKIINKILKFLSILCKAMKTYKKDLVICKIEAKRAIPAINITNRINSNSNSNSNFKIISIKIYLTSQ